ncbi:MAG: hypothetical protein ACRD51_02345 [Candidatus Acidiferrum sp.]
MSLISLVNLAERLLNQHGAQGKDGQASQKSSTSQAGQEPQSPAEDQFTPSSQNGQPLTNAQAAGLFSVNQLSFFSAAADFLLRQSSASQETQNSGIASPDSANPAAAQATSASTVSTSGVPGLTQAEAANAGADAIGALSTQPATTTASAAPSNSASGTALSTSTQQQLQTLNQALASLGLSPQDIQKLDQIASIINDFNPAAFTALAYQLEELAKQTSQLTPPSTEVSGQSATGAASAATSSTAAVATTNADSPKTSATVGGFQVQELLIKFAGVQGERTHQINPSSGAQGGAGSAGTTPQFSGVQIQVEEVNLTLVNGKGQTAQIQTGSRPGNAANSQLNQSSSSVKTRVAGA